MAGHLEAVDKIIAVLDSISKEDKFRSRLIAFLTRIWTPPSKYSLEEMHGKEIMRITKFCLEKFGNVFESETFVFGDYVHTNHLLGQGTEGKVYLGFQIPSGKCVAIKKIERASIEQREDGIQKMEKLMNFLLSTKHRSIVRLYHVAKVENFFYMYYEYIDGGDLKDFLKARDGQRKKLTESQAKDLFRKLLDPVDYLRKNKTIHRDLKPANFMLTRLGEVKLVDFSTMNDGIGEEDLTKTFAGTPAYMAPEMWDSAKSAYMGEKVDVWSMGVILYEMVCGSLPWNGLNIRDLIANVHKQPLALPEDASDLLKDILTHTLKINPRVRLNWEELIGHDWICETDGLGLNSDGLEEKMRGLENDLVKLQAKCELQAQAMIKKDGIITECLKDIARQKHIIDEMKAHGIEGKNAVDLEALERRKEEEMNQLRTEFEEKIKRDMETLKAAYEKQKTEEIMAVKNEIENAKNEEINGLMQDFEERKGKEWQVLKDQWRDEKSTLQSDFALQCSDQEETIRKLKVELEKEGRDCQEKAKELAAMKQVLEKREQAISQLQKELDILRNKATYMESAIANLRAELDSTTKEGKSKEDIWNERLQQLQKELEEKEKNIGSDKQAQIENLEKALAKEEQENTILRSDLQVREKEMTSAFNEVQKSLEREKELKEKVLLSTRQVVLLQDTVEKMKKEKGEEMKKLNSAYARDHEKAQHVDSLQATVNALKAEISKSNAITEELRVKRQADLAAKAELEARLKGTMAELEEARALVKDTFLERSNERLDNTDAREELDLLRKQLVDYGHEVELLRTQLSQCEEERRRQTEQYVVLEKEKDRQIQNLKDEVESLTLLLREKTEQNN